MAKAPGIPGGAVATRPLHFIWICDCSGSMREDGKIQTLNNAIREAIPHMRKAADENPNAQVLVRAISFSDHAQWHIATPTPVENFTWTDLSANGVTAMGEALTLLSQQLKVPPMAERALPPVLVLVSDGQPTDNFSQGLTELLSLAWGKRAVRTAIAIGDDADLGTLTKFIAHPEFKPLQANNPESLMRNIKWVSTAVLKAASQPAAQAPNATIVVPPPPPPANGPDTW